MNRLVAIACALVLLPAASAAAATYTVTQTADTPAGEACAGTTGCSLRQAVTSANGNPGADTILVAPGTYALLNGQLESSADLRVERSGAGTAQISGGTASRIFSVAGGSFELVSMTLVDGFAASGFGGAIRTAPGTALSVQSSTLRGNQAAGSAGAAGGAVYAQGPVTVTTAPGSTTPSRIGGNVAVATAGGATAVGGGIATNGDGSVTIGPGTLVDGNAARVSGAAARASGGGVSAGADVTITLATVARNVAEGAEAVGGGVSVSGTAALTAVRSMFEANTVRSSGTAQRIGGGAIALGVTGNEDLELRTSTLYGNGVRTDSPAGVAGGGALLALSAASTIDIRNSTIAGNAVTAPGGGSARGSGVDVPGVIGLGASILAENVPADQCGGGAIASGGADVLGGLGGCAYAPGAGDVTGVTDAGLDDVPVDYGVAPRVMRLRTGSPALDVVAPADPLCAAEATDQRGSDRPRGGGCDAGAYEARPATLKIIPASQTFLPTRVGQASEAPIGLVNEGDLAQTAAPEIFVAAPFSHVSGCTEPLGPGAVCEATFRFAPSERGLVGRFLTVVAGPVSDVSELRGIGTAPVATLTPAGDHDFGGQAVGTASPDFAYTLTNAGDVALGVGAITADGEFAVAHDCAATLAPSVSCAVRTRFAPTGTGARAGTLRIASDGGEVTRALSGTGIEAAATLTPAAGHDFGAQQTGSTSVAFGYELENTGSAPLPVGAVALTGDPQFAVSDDCAATLAPGAVCAIATRFVPTTAGAKTATLSVAGLSRTLKGEGVTPLPFRCSGREITIIDLRPQGRRLVVRGLALAKHGGRTATIAAGAQRLGTALIAADGSFTATVPSPGRARARLSATVDGKASARFILGRRFVILGRKRSGDRLLVTARVRGAKRGTVVTVRRALTCSTTEPAGTAKVGRRGAVTLRLPLPAATEGVALFRAVSPAAGGRTFSLPIVVTPQG